MCVSALCKYSSSSEPAIKTKQKMDVETESSSSKDNFKPAAPNSSRKYKCSLPECGLEFMRQDELDSHTFKHTGIVRLFTIRPNQNPNTLY